MTNNATVAEAFQLYQNTISILKKGYAQEKWRVLQICRSFLGSMTVRDVTSVHIATYRDARLASLNPKTRKPLSNSTVRLEMSLLSSFFDICRIEWGFCDVNPVSNVRKPKNPPGRERRLTAREERLIMRYAYNHSNPDLYSIVVVALQTGMRQSEILNLRWEHINLKSRIAHLPETKNGTKRDVPLSIKARSALIRMGVESRGPVFKYTSSGIKSTWRFMMQKLDIEDLHFHDLRHACITRLFELGTLDIMEIASISGHKSLSMLKRYTHLSATKLVAKLEGNKHKGKQVVLDHMIPYPASVEYLGTAVTVKLLDFEDLSTCGPDIYSAILLAQDALLRRIMISMRDTIPIPSPDQYLDLVSEDVLIMIDPLSTIEVDTQNSRKYQELM